MADLFIAQLADPFRIALSVALVATMLRTRAETGTWTPLALGILFISVLIPMTLGTGPGGLVPAVAVGLVSTGLTVAACLLLRTLVLKAMGR